MNMRAMELGYAVVVLFGLLITGNVEIYIVTVEGESVINYKGGEQGFEATAVKSVERDWKVRRLTRHTPQFLGLPTGVWPTGGGFDRAGEDIVIGFVDSGIFFLTIRALAPTMLNHIGPSLSTEEDVKLILTLKETSVMGRLLEPTFCRSCNSSWFI